MSYSDLCTCDGMLWRIMLEKLHGDRGIMAKILFAANYKFWDSCVKFIDFRGPLWNNSVVVLTGAVDDIPCEARWQGYPDCPC